MGQRDLVHGIPAIKHTTQIYDVCLIGKHSRATFPKKAKARSTLALDLVYGDLCGPISTPKPFGKKYIFLLVDDYSRYMWVYFLSKKAFDTFKEYKKTIENELRTTLKMLRTDRGGEFTSSEFKENCKENDALIITSTPKKEINNFKAQMEEKLKMSDLGLLAYYLGIEVTQTGGDISIKQSANAIKILKEAGMIDCDETLIPMDPGTRLTKLTEGTMINSTEYRRTKDYGITYKHNGGDNIHGFSDSSYGVNTQEGERITGIIFYYGVSPISWSTQKQATVTLASCEYEFIAATAVATQTLWLKRQLSELTHSEEEKITIMVDNKSAIALTKNPIFHGRSKHIDTKYHFIRECVEREDIQVEFCMIRTCVELHTYTSNVLVGDFVVISGTRQQRKDETILYRTLLVTA
nr:ribonuclease H-like domain, reverse transcriptase, RNA-dependent DNA polymerase [Tanacetum cinerariifolium]